MTDSEWLDLKAKLLYESGMTLREMRKFLGGVSWQRIQQRLKTTSCKFRPSGPSKGSNAIYSLWQKVLARRVKDLGFSEREVDYLLSFPYGTTGRSISHGRKNYYRVRGRHFQNSGFRLNIVHTAWIEARNNILLHARASGATFKEIAELAGFKEKSEISLIALKRHCKRKRVSQ